MLNLPLVSSSLSQIIVTFDCVIPANIIISNDTFISFQKTYQSIEILDKLMSDWPRDISKMVVHRIT